MVGLELPVLAMEHHYLITEEMPEVVAYNKETGKEIIHCIDFDGEIYMRQERSGMLMGTYEPAGKPWSPINTPWDFGHELLQPGPRPHRALAGGRLPALSGAGAAGIKKVINGPFTFAPDGNPLVGPMRGLALLGRLRRDGRLQPGRRRRAGACQLDDRRRSRASMSGRWMSRAMATGRRWPITNEKVRENYSPPLPHPLPERGTAGGAAAADHAALRPAQGAWARRCGAGFGLEMPLWFAPEGREGEVLLAALD